MTPTMHLRWTEADNEQEEGPCAVNIRYWPECGQTGYVLEQWWEGENDEPGEWKAIECGIGNAAPAAANTK